MSFTIYQYKSLHIKLQMHALKTENPALLQRIITYSFRGIALIMIPISANVPSVSFHIF